MNDFMDTHDPYTNECVRARINVFDEHYIIVLFQFTLTGK